MKHFIIKSIYFLIPLMLLLLLIELFIIYYPNTFNVKNKFIDENAETVEVLFLGSSQTQNSINPEYFEFKTANLAYGSQDYQLDNALFKKYFKEITGLKTVILELDYHSLFKKNSPGYFRLPWYHRYYDVMGENLSFKDKNLIYFTSPSFFNNYIYQTLSPHTYHYEINKYGFVLNDYPGKFVDFKFDDNQILKSSSNKNRKQTMTFSKSNYSFNSIKLNEIINTCISKNVEVVILKNPVYKSYSHYYSDLNDLRNNYLDSLKTHQPSIEILNFEFDERFILTDFKNENHLNPDGAKKLSLTINEFLKTKP